MSLRRHRRNWVAKSLLEELDGSPHIGDAEDNEVVDDDADAMDASKGGFHGNGRVLDDLVPNAYIRSALVE